MSCNSEMTKPSSNIIWRHTIICEINIKVISQKPYNRHNKSKIFTFFFFFNKPLTLSQNTLCILSWEKKKEKRLTFSFSLLFSSYYMCKSIFIPLLHLIFLGQPPLHCTKLNFNMHNPHSQSKQTYKTKLVQNQVK